MAVQLKGIIFPGFFLNCRLAHNHLRLILLVSGKVGNPKLLLWCGGAPWAKSSRIPELWDTAKAYYTIYCPAGMVQQMARGSLALPHTLCLVKVQLDVTRNGITWSRRVVRIAKNNALWQGHNSIQLGIACYRVCCGFCA